MEFSKNINTMLLLVSGVGWTLAYILIIYRSFRDKICGMPFWALSFNLSWEFIFSFVFILRKEIQFFVRVWLVLDLLILAAYLLYGKKEWPPNISRRFFYPYSVFVFVDSYLFVYLMSLELNDPRGVYTAFISNLLMSFLFISMLNKRKGPEGQSIGIAFFKMVGTLASTILLGVESHFVLLLGISIFVVDMAYFILLVSYYRRANIHLFAAWR
ncbi:MAG: hypothetical protein ABI760_11555 [Ferruginibacter sp.]